MLNMYTTGRSPSPRNSSKSVEVQKFDTLDSAVAQTEQQKVCWTRRQQTKQKEGSMWVPGLTLRYEGPWTRGQRPEQLKQTSY